MKELYIDWGIGKRSFNKLYQNFLASYKAGVSLVGNCIYLDNEFVKGSVEMFPLNDKIEMFRVGLNFSEQVVIKKK